MVMYCILSAAEVGGLGFLDSWSQGGAAPRPEPGPREPRASPARAHGALREPGLPRAGPMDDHGLDQAPVINIYIYKYKNK